MCEWLAEYEALRDMPNSTKTLTILPGQDYWSIPVIYVHMPDGDCLAVFYGTVGSQPPQDARRNALLFVKAWEAAQK